MTDVTPLMDRPSTHSASSATASAEEARIKGTKIKSKLAFVEGSLGAETLEAVIDHLPPEIREDLRRVLDLGWYPIRLYNQLLEAIVEVAGGGDQAVVDQMGRETAEYQARHAYSVYFRNGDPRALLQAMVPMHSQINQPGRLELVDHGERSLSLLVFEPPTTLLSCRLARAFYQRAMELVGGDSARVIESACRARGDEHCRFDMRW